MAGNYTHADAIAELAAIEGALASADRANIASAAVRARSLLRASGQVGNIISSYRPELARLLDRCNSEVSSTS